MRDETPTVSEQAPDGAGEQARGAGTVATAEPIADRPVVPGYELVRILGRGGMGIVWEAIEHRFDRHVALKVHAAHAKGEDLLSEALAAGKIADPSIVRVFDVGFTLDMRPYYAMELVHGTDLGTLLRDGPIAPRKAIAIAADIARAAAAAHEHGVIHRDLKPRNVIIDESGRARVLDFGVAFNVATGKDPFAGTLTGSPSYMSPEQVLGLSVVPQSDIFAIGVILYEMLTGERPFGGATTLEILDAVATREPPSPSAKNAAIHPDLDAVVARCLAKAPEKRFASGRALFETLGAIAEGRPIEAETRPRTYAPKASVLPPRDKPRRDEAKKHIVWTLRLASPPHVVWPFVANTDRFNKAVGLSPVVFTDEPQPEGGVVRTGEMRVLGMAIRWREYPFEWVKDREHSVFRWYRAGPLSALWNRVSLEPTPDGGTELRHEVWILPSGVIGQVASFVEIERKLGPAAERFYRHLDEVLVAGGHVDPFEPPRVPSSDQRAVVDAGCTRLHGEGFLPTLVEKLAMHLLTSPESTAGTLRPYELADTWKIDRGEMLDALVHAAHVQMVEPAWDVVCPKCMLAHETVHDLSQVTKTGTCRACATTFERDLRDTVELVFVPHPSVRRGERATYCAGAPALRPHILAQQVLDPGEERRVTLDLGRGPYRVVGSLARGAFDLVASAVGFEGICTAEAKGERIEGRPGIVRAGPVTFVLRNDTPHEETIRIEVPGARVDAVSAAAALTHPSFRDLFSHQVLAQGEHLRVSHLAFLFVEPRGREGLFEKLGDPAACAEMTRLEELIQSEARDHEGTLVPSSLERFVVAFPTAIRALRAGLALRKRLDEAAFETPVAIAAHDGRCLALTREGKSEFFGETLHRGLSLLGDCPLGGLACSASFAGDRAVAVAMHESGMRVAVTKSENAPYAGRRVTLLVPA